MCEPISAISMGLTAVSGIFGASASSKEAAANKRAYEMQAAIDRRNADMMDQRAADAIARGNLESQGYHRRTEQARGRSKASLGASGISMDVGSPVAVFAGLDAIEAVDQATIAKNAEREAFAYRTEAFNLRESAGMKSQRASQENPALAGFTSMLGTGRQLASDWYSFSQAGAF